MDMDLRCLVCSSTQTPASQTLICINCHKQKLETLLNSCIENDRLNDGNRQDINRIFEISQSIRSGRVPEQDVYSSQPMKSIKVLSFSLLKRELVNKSIRIRNIDRSAEAIQQKVFQLNEQIVNKEHEIKESQHKMRVLNSSLCDKYFNQIQITGQETMDTKLHKIVQIQKQSAHIQQTNFRVLKELALHHKGYMSRTVLLFNQPVIDIDNFFEFNNKLFHLNGFLENLIRLQVHLVKILDIKLPYLDELVSYLPDSEFHELVQQKESFMINGGDIQQEGEEEQESEAVDINGIDSNTEKIVKLGGTIKLPLSSKTINNQLRRASLAKVSESPSPTSTPSKTTPRTTPKTTPKSLSPQLPNPSSSPRRPSLKANLTGKKVVIVPHKILTKPFTKLSSREYLKFLSVIVKILVNFKVALASTLDTIPKNTNISSAFTNTISHLRNSIATEDKDGYLNFSKVLVQITRIDEYFDYKIGTLNQKQLPVSNSLHVSNYAEHNSREHNFKEHNSKDISGSSLTHSSPFVIGSQELKDLKQEKTQKLDGIRNFYHNLFKEPAPTETPDIYGVFSINQTPGTPTPGTPSPSPTSGSTPVPTRPSSSNSDTIQADQFITPKHDENDLKSIMQAVNQLMLNGSNRSQTISSNSHNIAETFNMMVESKSKLDDWDIVSKMYQ